jgi:hypothetical protein
VSNTSVYPVRLDTDVTLSRVTADSALTPPVTNNLTNAIETMQPAIGTFPDGSELFNQTWASPLAHQAGVLSTASPNPLYPYLPVPSTALYAQQADLPSGWSLVNCAASWSLFPGLLALTALAEGPFGVLGPLAEAPPEYVVARVLSPVTNGLGEVLLGYMVGGDELVDFYGASALSPVEMILAGAAESSPEISLSAPDEAGEMFYLAAGYSDTALAIYASARGQFFRGVSAATSALAGGASNVFCGAVGLEGSVMALQFVTQGLVPPVSSLAAL